MTLLQAAEELGVNGLRQRVNPPGTIGRQGKPDISSELRTNAQRAIQFVRNIPGVTTH
jgi:hypothetical protein